jgi:hypothetical protein
MAFHPFAAGIIQDYSANTDISPWSFSGTSLNQ